MKKCETCKYQAAHKFVDTDGEWYAYYCTLHKFPLFCRKYKEDPEALIVREGRG